MICITHVRGFESLIVGLERVQQGRCVIDMSGTRGVRIRACRTLVLHDGLYKTRRPAVDESCSQSYASLAQR